MAKDYYDMLGVSRGATAEEIKKAFRKLAHQHHPDKQGGDEKKFKEINEAYQVLGNDEKRKQYDQYGATFDQQGGFGGGMNWEDFMSYARGAQQSTGGGVHVDFGDLGDIFGDIFGGGFGGFGSGGRRKQSNKGRDLELSLELSFKDAVFGVEKELELQKLVKCKTCVGSGAEPGSAVRDCTQCHGAGQVQAVRNTMFGSIQTVAVCPKCHGEGKEIETACPSCKGDGRKKESTIIPISIPAGIDSGMSIRMSGQGEAGLRNDVAGDLYISVRVKPSPDFTRQGDDIFSKKLIPFSLAALGGKVDITTIDGEVSLKIPAGTQSNTVFSLKGRGVTHFQRGGRGVHLVEVIIDVPHSLTKEQKGIMGDLEKSGL